MEMWMLSQRQICKNTIQVILQIQAKMPWQILVNIKEQSSPTVEVVIQELEQLVMLLSQVGEVDEKSGKTKRLVQPRRNEGILLAIILYWIITKHKCFLSC